MNRTLIFAYCLFFSSAAYAENVVHNADNTAVNVRDQDGRTQTAFDQSNKAPNLEITRRIREAIVKQNQLSTYAQNVKVITDDNGVVTLRGPVKTVAEQKQVETIARENAGGHQIVSQLEIAPEVKR